MDTDMIVSSCLSTGKSNVTDARAPRALPG